MQLLNLIILKESFNLYRLKPGTPIPFEVLTCQFFSVTQTKDELSILVMDSIHLKADKSETGWRAFRVAGALDFSLTGILAEIAATLAAAGISIFTISTFDTDYIFIKGENLECAVAALKASGHSFA